MGTYNLSDIDSNQTAATASASSSQSAMPAGTYKLSDITENQTAPDAAKTPPASDYLTKTEDFVHSAAQGVGDAAKDVWGVAKGMVPGGPAETGAVKSIWSQLPPVQLLDATKQVLPLINVYEKARAGGASVPDAIKASDAVARQHFDVSQKIQAAEAAYRANPTRETARAVADASALAATIFGGGEAAAAEATPEEAAATAGRMTEASAPEPILRNPWRQPNVIRRSVASPEAAGDTASQRVAQAGVPKVAPTVTPSFRSGIDVETPYADAKKLYGTVDDAAKTDFKALYDKLDGAQDAARQALSGSQDEAKAQLAVKNAEDNITDAKKVAAQSGVPNVDKMLARADAKFTETQANKDFNSKWSKVISGNIEHGAPETIDVGKGIQVLEDMDKPNKYGKSRLQQTSLGPDGAKQMKQVLYDAQKAGQKAMDLRAFRGKVASFAKWAVPAAAGAGVGMYELTK